LSYIEKDRYIVMLAQPKETNRRDQPEQCTNVRKRKHAHYNTAVPRFLATIDQKSWRQALSSGFISGRRILAMGKLLGSNTQFFARTGHAGSDQHALGFLPHYHPGDRHAFISLVFMPGDQLVLMKLGLGIQWSLLLKHVYTTLPI
jgi:hypothetical protein